MNLIYMKIEVDTKRPNEIEVSSFDVPKVLVDLYKTVSQNVMFIRYNGGKCLEFIGNENYINNNTHIENIIKKSKTKLNITKKRYDEV